MSSSTNQVAPALLSGLYYPFSRCVDANALKQLLLVFDCITFLDPVEDAAWRAQLFRDLEAEQGAHFQPYRDLEAPLRDLEQEGAIRHLVPRELDAIERLETSASAMSDLSDDVWCNMARQPARYRMPYRPMTKDALPSWQVFPSKLPRALRAQFDTGVLRHHVFERAGEHQAWSLSHEAGSAALLNMHLAVAEDFGLAPVTDSPLHHRLLLRKAVRSATPESQWSNPSHASVDAVAHQIAMQLVDGLLPHSVLTDLRFEAILRFREATRGARLAMVDEIRRGLAMIPKFAGLPDIEARQQEVVGTLQKELREYRASLSATRDRLWPSLLKAAGTGLPVGTVSALVLQHFAGGALGIVGGSIAAASWALLQSTLESRVEQKRLQQIARPAVAYLSRVGDLH
ncbi:hypothetical protein [Roseateles sp.]|uniref:hypothetical protein n=1 Tax=Roseateles sp. TaxID=1971397 RepID=UPI0031DA0813